MGHFTVGKDTGAHLGPRKYSGTHCYMALLVTRKGEDPGPLASGQAHTVALQESVTVILPM